MRAGQRGSVDIYLTALEQRILVGDAPRAGERREDVGQAVRKER